MNTLLFVLVIIFFAICIYQLNLIKISESTTNHQKRWLSIVMGLFTLPILKLLDRILIDFGMSENVAFWLSSIFIGLIAITIIYVTKNKVKANNKINNS